MRNSRVSVQLHVFFLTVLFQMFVESLDEGSQPYPFTPLFTPSSRLAARINASSCSLVASIFRDRAFNRTAHYNVVSVMSQKRKDRKNPQLPSKLRSTTLDAPDVSRIPSSTCRNADRSTQCVFCKIAARSIRSSMFRSDDAPLPSSKCTRSSFEGSSRATQVS